MVSMLDGCRWQGSPSGSWYSKQLQLGQNRQSGVKLFIFWLWNRKSLNLVTASPWRRGSGSSDVKGVGMFIGEFELTPQGDQSLCGSSFPFTPKRYQWYSDLRKADGCEPEGIFRKDFIHDWSRQLAEKDGILYFFACNPNRYLDS